MKPSRIINVYAPLCLGLLILLSSTSSMAQKLSPSDAAASARDFTNGKVLKVDPITRDGVDYRVKMLLPEGQVRNIIIDGDSGKAHFRKGKGSPQHRPPAPPKGR
jgi:hypothetical protein